jgi:hypothetical protein
MTVSPQGMSIQALYRAYRDGLLIVNRQYQRKLVWTVAEKQKLIDSILQDYPLPLFLFAEKPTEAPGSPAKLEIIDGLQRLNAIFSYIEHGFKWEEKCFNINEFSRARQAAERGDFKEFTEEVERLPAQKCADMLDYQLAVTIFPGELDTRITDVFGRINSGGKQLSDQERRQAGVLSPFAEVVRSLAAEIRGDVSRDTLLLSEMPEISIETSRNTHGYTLKAEDIFWCYQGILRTGDLRESDDEQAIADICASILLGKPAEASGEFLNRVYSRDCKEYSEINTLLAAYGRDRIAHEVKTVFSSVRASIESYDTGRFTFRKTVYPKPTANAQKAPFFAVFMAFYELMFRENMAPSDMPGIMKSLKGLAKNIDVGQKHVKSADREKNIRVTKGLVRDYFVAAETSALSHGPGMLFDFENSIRRSRTETTRYEFKQGILRLDAKREVDPNIIQTLLETVCGIANVGPELDGYLYLGIADKQADAKRISTIDSITPVKFEHVEIVGIEREAVKLGISLERYMRKIEDAITNSAIAEPLKTQLLTSIDHINYNGLAIVRIRVPRQTQVTFLGDECFLRLGSSTKKATGPQIAAIAKVFSRPNYLGTTG